MFARQGEKTTVPVLLTGEEESNEEISSMEKTEPSSSLEPDSIVNARGFTQYSMESPAVTTAEYV